MKAHMSGPWKHSGQITLKLPHGAGDWDTSIIQSTSARLDVAYLAPTAHEEDGWLLAAAPELLSALEALAKTHDSVPYAQWTPEMHAADAAIKKARGKA